MLTLDYRAQEELEQERMEKSLEVLKRVRKVILFQRSWDQASLEDLDFLAAELGLTEEWRKLCKA